MKFPKCQHGTCCEISVCYLPKKKLYLCQQDSLTQYPDDDPVPLVDDSIIEMSMETIEICCKDFLAFTQMLNKGRILPDHDALSTTVREELKLIFDELKKAQEAYKYYKFLKLHKKTLKVKDVLQQDPLYIEFLVARAWSQSLSTVKGESLKSSELVEMELKRKYNATFDTMFQKFKEFRHDIDRRHQQEVDELRLKIQEYKEEKKSLKRAKRELITRYNLLCDEYEEFKQKAHGLESSLTSFEEENKGDGEKIIKLQEYHGDSKQRKRTLKMKLREEQASYQASIEDLTKEICGLKDRVKSLQKDIRKTEMRNDKLVEENKAKEEDYEQMKESLLSKLNLSECSYFNLLYKITTGEDIQIGPRTRLDLSLNNPKHMGFLSSLTRRMPGIDRLDLDNIPLDCQEVKTFLANHFFREVEVLHFNCHSSLSSSLSFYLDELKEASKRVIGHLYIYNFEVSQDQLVSLFSANRHKEWFGFKWCKLDLSSVPDFGGSLAESTMYGLSLYGCGGSSYCDWDNNESNFENLVTGLAKEEDFRRNLEWIDMFECGMEKSDVEEILEGHGFGHVEIYDHSK
ncbi:unnamed protein product [Moneuplotes crassus]|uniref:Uncharacterized protein n=1 Tax=Euplotes crassus TaxID=5936 RepID=A0AAD1UAB4_EUPCR|nr:unnamed protein product [Moneuplotes crassus]